MKDRTSRWVRARHAIEYALFRAVETVALSLPRPAALAFGEGVGRLLYRLGTSRTRVARENFDTAFPGADVAWRETTLEASFGHFGRLVIEIIRLPRDVRQDNWTSHAEIVGLERVLAERDAGRALILAGGHLGNWELAARVAALAGLPLLVIARPVNNPYLEEYFGRIRNAPGQRTVTKHGGMRAVVAEIRRERGVLAILVDQDARHQGVFVDYFGRPASTTPTAALLAVRYGAVVVPFRIWREGRDGRYRMEAREPLRPRSDLSEEEAILDLTRRYTKAVEEAVREHPDQYLWMHKRWKTRPPIGAGS